MTNNLSQTDDPSRGRPVRAVVAVHGDSPRVSLVHTRCTHSPKFPVFIRVSGRAFDTGSSVQVSS
jgi:hypothetical protein